MFDGFSKPGLSLLSRLPSFAKPEFEAQRVRYKSELQEPLKAFVDALGPALQERISPTIRFAAKTNGSIGPINNDVRFKPGAPTYKDHVLLRFWDGEDKKTSPNVYVRLTGTEVGFAAGALFADVERWRAAVAEDGRSLAGAISRLQEETGGEVVGQDLKRVPSPYPTDHPSADLLRHKWLQIRWPRPLPPSVGSSAFVEFCVEELARARDVHRWLTRRLG